MVALSIRIDLRMKTQLSKGYKFLFFYLIIIDSTYLSAMLKVIVFSVKVTFILECMYIFIFENKSCVNNIFTNNIFS